MKAISFSESFDALRTYCERQQYKGWDPYDGLNSRLFQSLPFIRDNAFCRLAWIQFMKRSPINFRGLTGVPKGLNPKGLALFLAGYCNLYRAQPGPELAERIQHLADTLVALRSSGFSGSCWGYDFDWQARAFFQPKHTPTVVATTYVATALLDASDLLGVESWQQVACEARHFILNDLNRTYDASGDFAFSYSPLDQTQVFNASLLGSRLLSRIYSYTGEAHLLEAARRSVAYCAKHQQPDGSWSYSTLPFHSWVDNFHTGFNLECMQAYQRYSGDTSFDQVIRQGLNYYINTFFTPEGIPQYYNNSVYPVDLHSTAQLVVTLSRLGVLAQNKALCDRVLSWTIANMQASDGSFYYQKTKYYTNRIPYMRWTQAWMFYGLSEYIVQVG